MSTINKTFVNDKWKKIDQVSINTSEEWISGYSKKQMQDMNWTDKEISDYYRHYMYQCSCKMRFANPQGLGMHKAYKHNSTHPFRRWVQKKRQEAQQIKQGV